MKKITKIFLSAFIIILCVSNIVFAVEDFNFVFDSNVVLDGTVNSDQNEENGIMPISEEIPEEWLRTLPEEESDISSLDDILESGEKVNISEAVYGDVYASGTTVEINSEIVDGNIYVIGNTVKINSKNVSGNVYVIGNTVEINSENIIGNVFAISENLKISGQVSLYLYAISDDMEISGIVSGVYAISNKFTLVENAEIIRDLKLASSEVNINGVVDRNISLNSENTNIGENALVYGKLVYNGNLNGNLDKIYGETEKYEIETPKEPSTKDTITTKVIDLITKSIVALIFIIIMVAVSKNTTSQFSKMKVGDYIKDIFIGLAVLIFTPVLAVCISLTIIGIPFAIIGILIYAVAIYLSITFLSFEISKLLLKENASKPKIIGVALLVYVCFNIVELVPGIGGLIKFFAILIGISAELKLIFRKKDKKEENKEEVKNEEDKLN